MRAAVPTGPARVLVIGEALIDVVPDALSEEPREHVGGSPANVALGLGRMGVPVRLRTALADDPRGRAVRVHLEASGVRVDPESFSLGRTSTATARIAEDGSADYEFDLAWELPGEIDLDGARVVHVGSIGCFLEPGAGALMSFLRSVAGAVDITFDPNVRPALIGDREEAVRRVEEIVRIATVVKLSDEDAEWLYPGWSAADLFDRYLAMGVSVVAVTYGARGAAIASRCARTVVPSSRVAVVDTVGAGDTFMAGLVDWASGPGSTDPSPGVDALEALGGFAAAAAAITVARAGADLPARSEVEASLRARKLG